MNKYNNKQKDIRALVPVSGIILFIVIYFVSAYLYPGGSQTDKHAVGFSWINNYWCNLLHDTAINGQHNRAKPVAITGMFVLCVSLSLFWFYFPQQVRTGRLAERMIRVSGTLAMVIAFFLFTHINHDLIIDLASCCGLVATTGTFIALYKNKFYRLFAFGICNILLVAINNYVYYTKGMIVYLPVVQKISFATFLIWVCSIDVYMYFHPASVTVEPQELP